MNIKPRRAVRFLLRPMLLLLVCGVLLGCRVEGELDPDFDRKDEEPFYGRAGDAPDAATGAAPAFARAGG